MFRGFIGVLLNLGIDYVYFLEELIIYFSYYKKKECCSLFVKL